MRAALLLLVLLLAGCASAPSPAANATTTAPTPIVEPPAAPDGPMNATPGAAMGPEVFWLNAQHGITVAREPPPAGKVAEENRVGGVLVGGAQGIRIPPWSIARLGRTLEVKADIEATISFSCDQPAVSGTEPFFPSVGGWVGAVDRYAVFLGAPDAPKQVDAGKTYTVTMKHPAPEAGLFIPTGESVTFYPYLGYQGPGTCSFLVGGPAGSRLILPHSHLNISAPRAVTLPGGKGELKPSPQPGAPDPNAVRVPITVPPDAVYVVIELQANPSATSAIDADLVVTTKDGTTLGSSTGPTPKERVVLGPTQLARGLDLVATVSNRSAGPGTFTVTVTAYAP